MPISVGNVLCQRHRRRCTQYSPVGPTAVIELNFNNGKQFCTPNNKHKSDDANALPQLCWLHGFTPHVEKASLVTHLPPASLWGNRCFHNNLPDLGFLSFNKSYFGSLDSWCANALSHCEVTHPAATSVQGVVNLDIDSHAHPVLHPWALLTPRAVKQLVQFQLIGK